MTLAKRDHELIWHPFTQEKTSDLRIVVKKAKGCYLYDENDKIFLDLISSWWVNVHGHANAEIARAIYQQSTKLEHVIFAGFTHEPAIELCEKLAAVLPNSLAKYFYSDNGSTSVEVAVKMSYQYWKNKNITKTTFLCLDGAYHGDTLGAMSVGKSHYHVTFSNLMFTVLSIPFAETWIDDQEIDSKENLAFLKLTHLIRTQSSQIAAFIVEPLVQGAAGMRMCRPQFIRKLVDVIREQEILVIFDEVMTGFGRTGTLFAFQQIGVVPDILCISKGITGGFLPLALTVTSNAIYEAFLADTFDKAFAHGHSYTANPIACAAAATSFGILTRPETIESIKTINRVHKDEMNKLMIKWEHYFSRARITGTIAAFDVDQSIDVNEFRKRCYEKGLLLRPLNSTFYIMPPYCIAEAELRSVYDRLQEIFKSFY